MSYKEMCEAAIKMGVNDFLIQHDAPGATFIDTSDAKKWKYYRRPTCEELAGMLTGKSVNQQFLWQIGIEDKTYQMWDHFELSDIQSQRFETLSEALLWAVMFEKGFQWDGKEFKEASHEKD